MANLLYEGLYFFVPKAKNKGQFALF